MRIIFFILKVEKKKIKINNKKIVLGTIILTTTNQNDNHNPRSY